MSVLSSGEEYTEDELLQVCQEMGLPFDPENIGILKEAIDELIAGSDFESEDFLLDASLFGNLSLSSASHLQRTTSHSSHETVSSPIQRIGRRQPKSGLYERQNREILLDVPTSHENEEIRRHNPTAYFLLNDAWRCLNTVYGTIATMEDVQRKLTSYGYSGPTSRRSASGNASKRSGDNKENELASRYRNQGTAKHSSIVKPSSLPTESNASEDESRGCSSEGRPEPDPSLRRVGQYVPGKLLYRHDPVKKFELYREEWARRPAIGEEKRLALRWKVREYMLRQSLPTFDPRKPTRPYAVHPKDWSPRPYLN